MLERFLILFKMLYGLNYNLLDKNDDKLLGFINRGIPFRLFNNIKRLYFPRTEKLDSVEMKGGN